MTTLIDYSTSRPPMNILRAAGVTGAGRYIGWDSVPGYPSIGKNLTVAESKELLGAGIEIFLAFEYAPDAAAQGTPQGTKDGQLAKTQLAELEAPPDMASYFAVDFDIPDYAPHLADTPPNALAKLGPVGKYFQAIKALKYAYEIGGYGGYYAIKRLFDAGLITKGWQTIAWSGGLLDPRACIYQLAATSSIVGADIDVREHTATMADYGQWPRPSVSPTTVPPQEGIVVSLTTGGAANVSSKDGGHTWVFGTPPGVTKTPLVQHGWVVSFTTKGKAHVTTTDGGYTWKYSA
jgi:hypothetical protein